MPAELTEAILRGTCRAMYAYDVGFAIDMQLAGARMTELRRFEVIRHKRRAPTSAGEVPLPLRVTQTAQPIVIGQWTTDEVVDLTLYEFGAVCVTYAIPLENSVPALVELSAALYDHPQLLADSRRRVDQFISEVRDAIRTPGRVDLVEDYVVFELRPPSSGAVAELWTVHGSTVAQILRAAPAPLSSEEVSDALAQRMAYGPDDAVLIDWHAAILVGDEMDDERSVLEFATVELLELRFLDAQLDRALDDAYEVLLRKRLAGRRGADLQRVARLQADNAILFEGINNAFKLLGDQYLARLYRTVSQRHHFSEWEVAIARKLQSLDSIYQKLSDRESTRRMELLEWIIIILIAVSTALAFVPGLNQ